MKLRCAVLLLAALSACTPPDRRKSASEEHQIRYQNLKLHTPSAEGIDTDPALSGDGKRLIFATSAHGATLDIYEKSLDGATSRLVTSSPDSQERFPAFNPINPRTVAFCSDLKGEWDIYVIADLERDSRAWARISQPGCDDIHPSWSPDGMAIVYSSTNERSGGEWILKVYDLKSKATSVLPVDGLLPEWNPVAGDNRIVFQRMRHRGKWLGGLWTLKFERGEAKEITEIAGSSEWAAINPSWSPDGKKIVFATVGKSRHRTGVYDEADDIWVVNADGTGLTQITVDEAADWLPVWAADGTILFTSKRNGRQQIWSLKPLLPF